MLKKDIFIRETKTIKDAFKKLDKTAEKVLIVADSLNRLLGTITDGDIRRYILKGRGIEGNLREIYNKDPIYFKKGSFSMDQIKKVMLDNKIGLLPILDEHKKVVDFITWSQAFSNEGAVAFLGIRVNIPVVIMAGGKGVRLEPFTKIIPKPLIPIGDKPIIELIIDGFKAQGIKEYYITLNHKGEMIKSYFNSIKKDYNIEYVCEDDFLGTAGSLRLLENKIDDNFIVSNSDVIVKTNFEEVLEFHKKQGAMLTILSSIRHYRIPYGVVKFMNGGKVLDIVEKPEYTFTINTGVYLVSRESLGFIPKKLKFDMTDLIREVIKNRKKVVMYPVNENDYIDVGEWEEYRKTVKKLELY